MPSFLDGKSRGAFEQPAFVLGGNHTTVVAFEKEFNLRAWAYSAKRLSRVLKYLRKTSNVYKWKKTFKRILNKLLVEGEKLKLRNLPSTSSLWRCSAANSVGTPDAKYSRASALWFFSVHNHGFCGGPNTFSQESKDTRVFISIELGSINSN